MVYLYLVIVKNVLMTISLIPIAVLLVLIFKIRFGKDASRVVTSTNAMGERDNPSGASILHCESSEHSSSDEGHELLQIGSPTQLQNEENSNGNSTNLEPMFRLKISQGDDKEC